MANAKASLNLQALPTSPSPAQSLSSEAVPDALKMILIGAPLNDVLRSVALLIEAQRLLVFWPADYRRTSGRLACCVEEMPSGLGHH